MDQNPYASPTTLSSGLGKTVSEFDTVPSRWKRFGNMFVDNFAMRIVAVVVVIVLLNTGILSTDSVDDPNSSPITLFDITLSLGTLFGYYLLTEGIMQRSLGKMLTGTKVVRTDGGTPTIGQIIGRTAARCIPFDQLSIFFHDDNRCWHDSLSGTRVVHIDKD